MMSSTKQSTQRRMLSPKNNISSPRLAKLGARSPSNKQIPIRQQSKAMVNSQALKGQQKNPRQFDQTLQLMQQNIPKRVIQNLEHQEVTFQNQDHYQGGTKNNQFYGKGTYYFHDQKIKYVGQFYNNQFHGWGILSKVHLGREIVIYEGNFAYGKRHGEGKYQYDGDKHYYNGNWLNDKKDGKGVYYFSQGMYNGCWKDNKKHGQGSLKLNNGTQYKGFFQNDCFVKGLIRYPNGDQYSGQIKNGKREGEGSYFSLLTQQRYKGYWKEDKKEGRGITYLQNGDQFQCSFTKDRINQTQSCTYKWNSGSDKGSVFNGWFKNGAPQKGHVTKINGQEFDTY